MRNVLIFFGLSLCLVSDLFAGQLRINEFIASNRSGLTTTAGSPEDWIELYNPSNEDVNLAGWSLTDSAKNLTKFQFPPTATILIHPDAYFIIYATGSETPIVSGQWHANFSLSRDGEYLALVRPDGTIEQEFAPGYPEQYPDISYGVIGNPDANAVLEYGYFTTPTPRRVNGENAIRKGRLAPVTFNEPRGFRTNSFRVFLNSTNTEATIRYTLDGSEPTETSTEYVSSLEISKTTVLRAQAFQTDYISSEPSSCTWIFLDDVLTQSTMRQRIVNNPNYSEPLRAGLTDIPTISLATASTNLYGSTGIFDNYGQSGEDWERPVSVELIDPTGNADLEFAINAGMRIRGATGRASAKKSLRLLFGSKYDGDLNFPLFGDEGAGVFSKVDLRTEQNNAWSSNVDAPWQNTFVREVFARDSQRDMGDLYTHSRYYHVYINGVYWGIYMTQERAEADFASSYLGGDSDEWDALKSSSQRVIELKDGTSEAYNQFYLLARDGFTGAYEPNYWIVRGLNPDGTRNPELPILLDEENLIHYILDTVYIADMDSPLSWINVVNNVNTVYHRTDPQGFKWLKHDAELSLGAFLGVEDSIEYFKNSSYWSGWNNFNPMDLHRKLIQHPEYYIHFMDEAEKLYRNGGVFDYAHSLKRWNDRMKTVERPVVAESARWGNAYGGGYTWETWKSACHQVTNAFLVGREYEMFTILHQHDWHSGAEAPLLEAQSDEVTIRATAPVYYTLDGSDPRAIGGSISSSAIVLNLTTPPVTSLSEDAIPAGATWRCYDSGNAPSNQRNYSTLTWMARLYNDYEWTKKAPADGLNSTTSYLRKSFVLDRLTDITSAKLTISKGSGKVSINGNTVTAGNIPLSTLRQGRNLVTVATSSSNKFDLSISITRNNGYWSTSTIPLADSLWLKARTLKNGVWSPLGELDARDLDNTDCSALRITEMMYSATITDEEDNLGYSRDDFAWIEFKNTGDTWINLKGVTFTSGIEYTFPYTPLAPRGYLVLAKNPTAFATRYNINNIQLLGAYSANLARKGETITVADAQGNTLITYTYSNTWYPETDRGGYSLTVVNTEAATDLWNTAENWKASRISGGTPGTDDDGTVAPPIVIAPRITTQPTSQTVTEGTTLLFSVTATGTPPLTYQWYKDGTAITGTSATEPQFIITSAQIADSGLYTVTIANSAATVTSDEARLLVKEKGAYENATLFHRYSFTPEYVEGVPVAVDSVSNANGTLFGNAALLTSETSTGYLTLDGAGDTRSFTDGSFVALPPDLISGFASFTVEIWARATANKGSWMRLFDFGNCYTNSNGTIGDGHNYTMMTWKSGSRDMRDGVRLEGNEQIVTSPYLPIGDGIFHHIVYAYNATAQTGYLYTDGAPTGSARQEFNPTQFGGCPNMWIGKSQWGADPYFAGDFDEFRIYEGVLTSSEVASNYQEGPNPYMPPIEPELTYTRDGNTLTLQLTGALETSTDLITWEPVPTNGNTYTISLDNSAQRYYRTRGE